MKEGCERDVLPTNHKSLKVWSYSRETTSSANGMNCKLYDDIVTSPSTPSSSRICVTSLDNRGTRNKVYVYLRDSAVCRLIWSDKSQFEGARGRIQTYQQWF